MNGFQISKNTDGKWWLAYPIGFDDDAEGHAYPTHTQAVEAFVKASESQCPTCLKGAVVDADWGWECTNCGSNDVAVGCVKPADESNIGGRNSTTNVITAGDRA